MADTWEPAEQAAKNDKGEYMGLIKGKWEPVQGASKNDKGEYMVLRSSAAEKPAEQAPNRVLGGEEDRASIGRQIGLTARAGGPVAAGAMAGAAMGSVLPGVGTVGGAVAGAGAMGVTQIIDRLGGTNYVDKLMDRMGLPKPETDNEKLAGAGAEAMAGAGGLMKAGTAMSASKAPIVARTGEQLAAQPGTQVASAAAGGVAGEAAKQEGAGELGQLGASLAGSIAPAAGARTTAAVLKPVESFVTAPQQSLNALAKKMGFTLTPGQETGNGRLRSAESTLKNAPGGGEYQKIDVKNREVLASKALETIGETGTSVTPEVLATASGRIGSKFSELVGNNVIKLGEDFLNRLVDIEGKYVSVWNGSDQMGKVLNKALAAAAHGTLSGKEYQTIRGSLQRDSIAKIRSGDSNTGRALSDLANALDDAAGQSIPKPAMAEWKQARQQYRNLLTLEDATTATASGKSGAGVLEPTQLISAVVKNRGAKNFAKSPIGGGDELADLARVAAGVRDLIPNSGTPERTYWLHLLGGGSGSVAGALIAGAPGAVVGHAAGVAMPYAATKAMTSDIGRKYLTEGAFPSLQKPLSRVQVPAAALLESLNKKGP